MKQEPKSSLPAPWIVLLLWVGAHVAGSLISNGFDLLLMQYTEPGFGAWLLMLDQLPIFALQAVVLGFWLRGLPRRSWFLRSLLAAFASNVAFGLLLYIVTGPGGSQPLLWQLVIGAMVGAGVGLAQSLILQRYVRYSELWIVGYTLGELSTRVAWSLLGTTLSMGELLLARSLVAGLLLGGITGLALLWLLRHRVQPRTTATSTGEVASGAGSGRSGFRSFGRLVPGIAAMLLMMVFLVAFLNPGMSPARAAAATRTAVALMPRGEKTPNATEATHIAKGWQLFKSNEGGFQVLLPGEPISDVYNIDVAGKPTNQYMFLASSELGGYGVLYTDILEPISPREIPKWVDEMTDGVIAGMPGKLLSEREITVQGNLGREIEIEQDNGTIVRSWIVIAGQRIYQPTTFTYDRQAAADEIELFLDSFWMFIPKVEVRNPSCARCQISAEVKLRAP